MGPQRKGDLSKTGLTLGHPSPEHHWRCFPGIVLIRRIGKEKKRFISYSQMPNAENTAPLNPKSLPVEWLKFALCRVEESLLLFFSHSVTSTCLRPLGLQHARLPCLSLSSGVCSNSSPLIQWCHPTISSSVTLFSSCPWSFPA